MTTKTIQILRLMTNGQKATVLSVSVALGYSVASSRNALSALAKDGYAASLHRPNKGQPAEYLITAAGIERSKFVPKTRAQLSRERYQRKTLANSAAAPLSFQEAQQTLLDARRAQAVLLAVRREELRAAADAVVMQGRAARHPLDMAWGGAHA